MSIDNPDQIRSEIETTRAGLSDNVNALADSVRPGNVARRQVDKVTDGVSSLKDKVMGSSHDHVSDATSGLQSSTGSAKDQVVGAPAAAARGTRGNPLAAGLIAFGGGLLLGSLLPASAVEAKAATAVKEKAQPLTDELTEAAKSVVNDLKEPAQDAAEQVRTTAAEAASTVKGEAQSTVEDVRSTSKDAVDQVRQNG